MHTDPIIEGFFDYCKGIKKLKHSSIKDIKCTLNKLSKFLIENEIKLFIWELDIDHFVRYLAYLRLKNEKGTGISKQLSQIRTLIDYCWKTGYTTKNPLHGYDIKDKGPHYLPRFLSTEEVTSLLRETSRKTLNDRRERLIILILYGLGLRTSELANIRIKDISIENQDVFVKGKFDIERRIPIPDGVWVELLAHLQENGLGRGLLFKTLFKKAKLSVADVGTIVKKYAHKAKLDEGVTPKTLRHTFASHLMDGGVDISIISSLMGHKSPRETGVYLHAFNKNKIEAIESFDNILEED